MESTDVDRPREEEDEEVASAASAAAAGDEEDTGAQVAPIVRLEEVAVTTGEEDEDVLIDLKAKLYRFHKEGNQWKERGTGSVRLLKHKESGRVRLVVRQAKTLKICANHLVLPSTKMQEHAGNEKSCVWHAMDFSDGELKEEMFAIRFGSGENCNKFKETVEEIAESFRKVEETENKDASSAASLLEKLSVNEATHPKEAAASVEDEKKEKDQVGEEEQAEAEESSSTS